MSDGGKDENVEALRRRIAELEQELERAENSRSIAGEGKGSEGEGEAGEVYNSPLDSTPQKSGYLFKWQDRRIGWGGTKWSLRYVSLNKGRLSYYRTHTDQAPRYVLTMRRCAVRDDGFKRNRAHASKEDHPDVNEVGAYYHVFSIYQRPSSTSDGTGPSSPRAEDDDESQIVPLLRFSTPSLAEKQQWIDLISEACAYCDSEDFLSAEKVAKETKKDGISFPMTPVARRGTLPPLIFGAPAYPTKRVPSGVTISSQLGKKKKSYTKISAAKDAARSNRRAVSDYPPSKPMHREAGPSFLSDEAPSQNFRGLFNLALIVLVVSNFRLILDTIRRHGFVLSDVSSFDFNAWRHAPLTASPFFSGIAILLCCTSCTYCIEFVLSRHYVKEWFGMSLHFANATFSLLYPSWIVWTCIDHPAIGAILLLNSVITWMKLISYAHANSDYRNAPESHRATVALVKDLDVGTRGITYPMNVTLSNIFYFWLAPTLTYQIVFPRSPAIRLTKVAGILFRLVIAVAFLLFLVAQIISPNLSSLIKELERSGDAVFSPHIFLDHLLKLSIANTYVWLLVFYIYFHLYLNLFAELLRFGDRIFYRDWWNSSNLSSYWRLWNQPVHFWLVRHVYFPSFRLGLSKSLATFVVFLLSAVLHEVLVSVPFHMVRYWSFLGMLGQLPLVAITKYTDKVWPGSSIGNVIFWVVFCVVGQPMAVLMYTIDYWKKSQETCAVSSSV